MTDLGSPARSLPQRQWQMRAARRAGRPETGRDFALDIVNAARALVEDDEILDFTVRQVIERAGVALKTFYRYFANKDELLLAMFEEAMQQSADRFDDLPTGDPIERLRDIVVTPIVMDFDDKGRRLTRWRGRERQRLLEFFPDDMEAVYEPYRAAIAQAIVEAYGAGGARAVEPDLDAKLVLHLVQEMAHGVHGGGIEDPPELVAERVWHMVRAALEAEGLPSPALRRGR
jgi:TetR/AcrR family transcriptional regulator